MNIMRTPRKHPITFYVYIQYAQIGLDTARASSRTVSVNIVMMPPRPMLSAAECSAIRFRM